MIDFFQKYANWIVILLLSLFALQVGYEIITYSSTYDEAVNINAKYAYFKIGEYADHTNHPVLHAFTILPFLVYNNFKPGDYDTVLIWTRIGTLFYGLLLGLFVFYFAKRFFGIHAGLFALFLYVFEPNILAHSSLATTDILVTCMIFIAIFCFKKFLDNQSLANTILAGLTIGLALAAKSTAILLLPLCVLLAFMHIKKDNKRKYFGYFALIFIIALFVINTVYLFNGSFLQPNQYRISSPILKNFVSLFGNIPIPLPQKFLESLSYQENHFEKGHPLAAYLMGKHSQKGWWYYFIIAFLIKTPIPLIILFISGLYILYKSQSKFKSVDALILPILIILIAFSFFNKVNIGLRYILPIYPFLIVIASKSVILFNKKWAKPWMVFLAIFYVFSAIMIIPYNLAYFNEFIGGPMYGYRYLIDSNNDWGQCKKIVNAYFKENTTPTTKGVGCEYVSGRVGISINELGDLFNPNQKCHEWLRNMTPVDTAGYCYLIFDVPKK